MMDDELINLLADATKRYGWKRVKGNLTIYERDTPIVVTRANGQTELILARNALRVVSCEEEKEAEDGPDS